MDNSITVDFLKNKKNIIQEQINKFNNDRNTEQEKTYRGLLFELSDIELRICAFESGLPIDVSTRNYSITEDGDSDSDISGLTKKIIKSNIPTADKLIIINNRKEALHGAQTLSMILIIIYYYLLLLTIIYYHELLLSYYVYYYGFAQFRPLLPRDWW